jgi:hypothetical protein
MSESLIVLGFFALVWIVFFVLVWRINKPL